MEPDVAWLRGLADYWREKFDWRTQEGRLNVFRQYKVHLHDIDLHFLHVEGRGPDQIAVPTGYSEFPYEMLRPPRSLAERTYTNIRRWTVMPLGGHFAAMEQPEALATEIREFFRSLRRG